MIDIKCKVCGKDIQAEDGSADDICAYCKMKQDKDARYEEYCAKYEQQLRLQRYIKSLERDIEDLQEVLSKAIKGVRRLKKLIKINERDINLYKKQLAALPPVPPFK